MRFDYFCNGNKIAHCRFLYTECVRSVIAMRTLSANGSPRQILTQDNRYITTIYACNFVTILILNALYMITQNPVTGHSKKKLGGVYARTLYGKNIIQTCPHFKKGQATNNQRKTRSAFGYLSNLSNQVSASLLNYIYYSAPIGRSRRMQWNKDLSTGMQKDGDDWLFNPSMIQTLGTNPKVSEYPFISVVTSSQLVIPIESLSAVGNAITDQVPCLILICPTEKICISLLDYTTLDDNNLVISNLSSTLINKQCWIFPLWLVNIGTQRNEILTYGSYQNII